MSVQRISASLSSSTATRGPVWPVWKGSVRGEVRFAPMSKRDAVKLYHHARRFERSTRRPGQQDGKLGRNGLAVLHALLFDFLNHRSGQLDPSYAAIASRACISIRSVGRGLVKLAAVNVLSWVKRCIYGGAGALVQLTNAYGVRAVAQWKGFSLPPEAPQQGTWGDHPPAYDTLTLAADALAAGDRKAAQYALGLDESDGLAQSLAKLGRARNAPA